MTASQIAVVGAGLMGHGIAQTLALAGYDVNLTDVKSEALAGALGQVKSNLETLVRHKVATRDQCKQALRRVRLVSDTREAVTDARFIIESISEDPALKKKLYVTLERACSKNTIIATNTSTIAISELAGALDRRGRFIGMHWWNPPDLMPLIEVVVGEETSEETVDATVALSKRLGKIPIVCRHGVLGTRLQGALMIEALRLVEEGAASAEDIDAVARLTLGLRLPIMGPLQIIDFGGARTVLQGLEHLPKVGGDRYAVPEIIRDYVERDWLGVESGHGFYTYTGKQKKKALKQRDEWLISKLKGWAKPTSPLRPAEVGRRKKRP